MNMHVHAHGRKTLYFGSLMVNYYIPFIAIFKCPGHYHTVGLEGGGIQLKIRICKCRRKEPHDLCKFFVGLPWQAFQQKWCHKQLPLSFPFRVWFLCNIVSSVFVNKELFVWLFNKPDWKEMQVIIQQRTGFLFFSFKVIGSWISSVTWCITQSHKQLSSAQMRDGPEGKVSNQNTKNTYVSTDDHLFRGKLWIQKHTTNPNPNKNNNNKNLRYLIRLWCHWAEYQKYSQST